MVHHTCRTIVDLILNEVMPIPDEDKWQYEVAENLWNMWHYKKSFTLVLSALVDAQYNFLAVDVSAYDKNSDAEIFANFNFGMCLEKGSINIPKSSILPGRNTYGNCW